VLGLAVAGVCGAWSLRPNHRPSPSLLQKAAVLVPTDAKSMPERVHVRVQSTPPGAHVSLQSIGEEERGRGFELPPPDRVEASGITPITLELPRGTAPRRLVLQMNGYLPAQETVIPDSEVSVQVALQPIAVSTTNIVQRRALHKPARATKPIAPKDLKAGDLADPFR
jgi:hypothetical protein